MTAFQIIGGPHRATFMLALFCGDSEHRHEVEFTLLREQGEQSATCHALNHPVKMSFIIDSVQREDGTDYRFNFLGRRCDGVPSVMKRGFYCTRTRHGRIVLE